MKYLQLIVVLFFTTATGFSQMSTWYEIPSGTTKKLNVIDFPSSDVGYIGGNDSLLLKSTDGGKTWQELNHSGLRLTEFNNDIVNLFFVTEDVGFLVVRESGGSISKTTDGGLNWTAIPANMCQMHGLYFFSGDNGIIGGTGCFIGEQIDLFSAGSATAATINTPGTAPFQDIVVDFDFYDANYGLAVSEGGRVLRTTDGGNVWDTIPTITGNSVPLTGIEIINDTLAYASYDDLGSGFGLLISTDSGLTWTWENNSATFYYPAFYDVHESGNGYVYTGAQPSFSTGGLIFESTSFGNWTFQQVDQPIYNMDSYNDSIVWAVGDSGYVVVNKDFGDTGLNDSYLDNNLYIYPNPVADILNFYIPETLIGQAYQIRIYSFSGELIFESNGQMAQVNVSQYETGMYCINLIGDRIDYTAKFVIK